MNNPEQEIQEFQTFERCPHDKENPYSMMSNSLIRDDSISPNCRWMLIYMLSNKEGWKIRIPQIIAHVKPFVGRAKVYKMINEAIDAGYIKKQDCYRPNPRGGSLKSFNYIVSETPKFKKCYRHSNSRHAGDRDAGKQHTNKEQAKENYSNKNYLTGAIASEEKKRSPSPPLSPKEKKKAEDTEILLAYCVQNRLNIKLETLRAWHHKWDCDRITRNLSLLAERVEEEQIITNHEKWMEASLKSDFGKERENGVFNRERIDEFLKAHKIAGLKVTKKYLSHNRTGREIYFKLDPEEFANQVKSLDLLNKL